MLRQSFPRELATSMEGMASSLREERGGPDPNAKPRSEPGGEPASPLPPDHTTSCFFPMGRAQQLARHPWPSILSFEKTSVLFPSREVCGIRLDGQVPCYSLTFIYTLWRILLVIWSLCPAMKQHPPLQLHGGTLSCPADLSIALFPLPAVPPGQRCPTRLSKPSFLHPCERPSSCSLEAAVTC